MGAEFKAKGAHVILGPVAGPLGRIALGGRNWEGFSPDPYLSGIGMSQTIAGLQSNGLQAVAKHYILNEQETQRNPSYPNGTMQYADDPLATIKSLSANADDRTMHELYLWPFADAVRAGVASVMCSYNRINGTYSCENSALLNGLLKSELGFQGYVMSDWGGTHSTIESILAGQDMEMPGDTPNVTFAVTNYWNASIANFRSNGSLTDGRLDDMLFRIMTPYFYLGQDQNYPSVDPSSTALNALYPASLVQFPFILNGTSSRDVREAHATGIRALGAQAAVLLKNSNNALPLKAPRNIGVFGNAAADSSNGQYSFQEEDIGVLPIGGGSGAARFTYIVSPLEAIKARGRQDGALVQYITNNTVAAQGISTVFPVPEVCLVFLKTYVAEGTDRTSYDVDSDGNTVVETVAATCNNTVVITTSGGINILPWADNPNVTAIIAAHFPGQEVGNSIADVLYGDVNPSGHLPYTIAFNETDYNTAVANFTGTNSSDAWQSDFTEGLMIDYRHFDSANITPRYEFGFGLSYTTFSLTNLDISTVSVASVPSSPANMTGPTPPGGNPDLYTTLFTVTASVTNTGPVAGATVPQLYILPPQSSVPPNTPPQALRGFDKVYLQPNASSVTTFDVTRRDLSYWDVASQQWTIPSGAFGVKVGFSSRDQPLVGSITLISEQ